jgi:hypothetical protein
MSFQVIGSIPRVLSYQGVLTDGKGNPVADSTYECTFTLYNDLSGGTSLWSESQKLKVVHGAFSVLLGEKNEIKLSFETSYYLGIKIENQPEMKTRVKLSASAYCFRADSSNHAITASVARNLDSTAMVKTDSLIVKEGMVIGTASPGSTLRMTGTIIADTVRAATLSLSKQLSFSSSYSLPSKVTIKSGDTAEIEFPVHLWIRGLPYRYALWVNVEGHTDNTQSSVIEIFRYYPGNPESTKWVHDAMIGSWTISGRDWGDNYVDLNISKSTYQIIDQFNTRLKIYNAGNKYIEIFAVGIIAEGTPQQNVYIQN